jgi:response regulator RpfG family c-di-GMP phosphodiesterase
MTQVVALAVENDTLQREAMADALKSHALEVVECTTGEAAELVRASVAPELVALVIDIHSTAECPVLNSLASRATNTRVSKWLLCPDSHGHSSRTAPFSWPSPTIRQLLCVPC